jgi:Ca2+-binding EF-hand superfamily protein
MHTDTVAHGELLSVKQNNHHHHHNNKKHKPTEEELQELEKVQYETEDLVTTIKGFTNWFIFEFLIKILTFFCVKARDLICGPPDDKIVFGKTPLLKMMNRLQVTEREATKFFKLFEQIDGDHSGSIEIDEFFTFFKMEPTPFAKRSFGVMDFEGGKEEDHKEKLKKQKRRSQRAGMRKQSTKKLAVEPHENPQQRIGDGSLSYGEFFVSLWNFCTLTHDTLVKFAFDLYDADGSGELTLDEVKNMVRMIRPQAPGGDFTAADKEAAKLMAIMDEGDDDGYVTYAEFMKAHRRLGTVIYPAFMLQMGIRKRAMSKKFWAKATKIREDQFTEGEGLDDLINMYKKYCAEKEAFVVGDADVTDADHDSDDERRMLEDLEIIKLQKEEERRQWALNANLEFSDWQGGDPADGNHANGLMVALMSKRLQSKIYHTPREGSWWSENSDVRGPRPPGVRPNSAKFVKEKDFMHEDDPAIVVDRGTADLMSNVDRARIRAKRGVYNAKRSVKNAKGMREEMDKAGKWNKQMELKGFRKLFGRNRGGSGNMTVGPEVEVEEEEKNKKRGKKGRKQQQQQQPNYGEDGIRVDDEELDDDQLDLMEGGGSLGAALGRGRPTARSPGRKRPTSGSGSRNQSGGGGGGGGASVARGARPQSAGMVRVGGGGSGRGGGALRPKSALPKLRLASAAY